MAVQKYEKPIIQKYEKPIIQKIEKMTFPADILKTKTGRECKQCSSCHSCR